MNDTAEAVGHHIRGMIGEIRGQKVVLDSDLAALYRVTTKALNQAVRRNPERFPAEFAFHLAPQEVAAVRSQIGNSRKLMRSQSVTASKRNIRFQPLAFTEHGALMAANVLRSPRAVEMSVFIVRAFVRMRGALLSQYEMAARLEQIEKILLVHDTQLHDLFKSIRPLLLPPPDPPSKPIGFGVRETNRKYPA